MSTDLNGISQDLSKIARELRLMRGALERMSPPPPPTPPDPDKPKRRAVVLR